MGEYDIDGVLHFNAGDTYTILDEEGQEHTIEVVPDEEASGAVPEGSVLVSVDDAYVPQVMQKEEVQRMADAYNAARLEEYERRKEDAGEIDDIVRKPLHKIKTQEDKHGAGNNGCVNKKNLPKKDGLWERVSDLWWDFLQVLWYLSWIAIIFFSIRGCYRGHVERVKEKEARKLQEIRNRFVADSIARVKDSIAHVMDSLKHDSHYQDSIMKKEKEDSINRLERIKWIKQHTLVITRDIDSIYHTSTNCDYLDKLSLRDYKDNDIKMYRLATEYETKGYKLCKSCEEREDKIYFYEDGEWVYYDDVPKIAKEDFGME